MTNSAQPRRTPRLRFPEFRAAPGWEEKVLRTLATPVTERAGNEHENIILTLSAERGLVLQSEYFGKQVAGTNAERCPKVQRDDFVYNDRTTKASAYGTIKRLTSHPHGIVSPIYKCFRFKEGEVPAFWEWYFEGGAHEAQLRNLANEGARAGRFNVTIDRFLSTSVWVPESVSQEQHKIADCLTALDKLIGSEGRKLDALKTHKKGLMQQVFPREGEARPRLRFPEFKEAAEWMCKTLGDVADISSGTTPARSRQEFYDGGSIPWVKTTDLNNSLIVSTEERIAPGAGARVNPVGSVLVAMYGGFNQIGRTGCLGVSAATNQAISVLVLDSQVALPVYVLAWLNARVEDWRRIAGSSRRDPNITGHDVARFSIKLPEVQEQERIASCLSSLDNLIAAQSDKVETLKAQKKGLMQQLFPSPTEVHA